MQVVLDKLSLVRLVFGCQVTISITTSLLPVNEDRAHLCVIVFEIFGVPMYNYLFWLITRINSCNI